MATEIDSISVRISASAADASSAIHSLCESLNDLKGAMKGINFSEFSTLGNGIRELAKLGTGTKGFTAAMKSIVAGVEAIRKLSAERIDFDNIKNSFTQVTQAMDLLKIENADSRIQALTSLGQVIRLMQSISKMDVGDGASLENINHAAIRLNETGAMVLRIQQHEFSRQIDTLESLLEAAKTVVSVEKILNELGTAGGASFAALNAVIPVIGESIKQLQWLGTMDSGGANPLAAVQGLSEVFTAIQNMSSAGTKDPSAGITKMADALKKLSEMFASLEGYQGSSVENIGKLVLDINRLMAELADSSRSFSENAFEGITRMAKVIPSIAKITKDIKPTQGVDPNVITHIVGSITNIAKHIDPNAMGNLAAFSETVRNAKVGTALAQLSRLKGGTLPDVSGLAKMMHDLSNAAREFDTGAMANLYPISEIITKDLVTALNRLSRLKGGFPNLSGLGKAFRQLVEAAAGVDVSGIGDQIAAIAALAEAAKQLNDLQNNSSGGKKGSFLGNLMGGSKSTSGVLDFIKQIGIAIKDMTVGSAKAFWGLLTTAKGVAEGIWFAFKKALPDLAATISGVVNKVLAPVRMVAGKVQEVFSALKGKWGEALKAGLDVVKTKVVEIAPFLGTIGKGIALTFKGAAQAVKGAVSLMVAVFPHLAKAAQTAFKLLGSVVKTALQGVVSVVKGIANVIGKTLGLAFTGAVRTAGLALRGLRAVVSASMNGIAAQFKVFGKVASVGVSAVKAFGRGIKGAIGMLKTLHKNLSLANTGIGKLIKRFANRALSMAMRSLIKQITSGFSEGLENLQYASATANATMQQLNSSALNMKNAMGGALYSALYALRGVIESVTNAVVRAMNAISSLFSALAGGKSFQAATTNSKALAKSLGAKKGGAAHSAKQLKQILMGFDEINSISPSGSSGSGGGSGSSKETLDYAAMFKEQLIDQKLLDAVQSMDFTLIGKEMGDNINSALDAIPWSEVYNKATGYAKGFATLINGLAETLDTDRLAETIAKGVNTAVDSVNKFWNTTDWAALGTKLSTALMKSIRNIDAKALGKAISAKTKAGFKFFNSFMKNLKWADVTKFMDGILEGIKENFSDGTPGELVNTIADFVREGIESINPAKIANAFTTLLSAGMNAIRSIVNAENVSTLGGKLIDFIQRISGTVGSEFGTSFSNMLNIASAVLTAVKDGLKAINWDTIKTNLTTAMSTFTTWFNTEVASIDPQLIANTLSGVLGSALTLIKGFWNGTDWVSMGTQLGTAITEWVSGVSTDDIGSALVGMFNGAIGLLSGLIETVDVTTLQTFVTGVIDSAVNALDTEKLSAVVTSMITIFDTLWHSLLAKVNTMDLDTLKGFFAKVIQRAVELLKAVDLPTVAGTIMSLIKGLFATGASDASQEGASSLATSLTDLTTTIGDAVKGCIEAIDGETLANALGDVLTGIFGAIASVGDEETMKKLADVLVAFINKAVAMLPELIANVATIAVNIMKGITSSLTNNSEELLATFTTAINSIISNLGSLDFGTVVISFTSAVLKFAGNLALSLASAVTKMICGWFGIPTEWVDAAEHKIKMVWDGLFEVDWHVDSDITDGDFMPVEAAYLDKAADTYTDRVESISSALGGLNTSIDRKDITSLDELATSLSGIFGISFESGEALTAFFTALGVSQDLDSSNLLTYVGAAQALINGFKTDDSAVTTFTDYLVALAAEAGKSDDEITALLTTLGLMESVNITDVKDDIAEYGDAVDEVSTAASGYTDPDINPASISDSAIDSYTDTAEAFETLTAAGSEAEEQVADVRTVIQEIPTMKTITLNISNYDQLKNRLSAIVTTIASFKSKTVRINVDARLTTHAQKALEALKDLGVGTISVDKVSAVLEAFKTYANGGYPANGEMFIANEAGPELVGRIGHRTAVANEGQIGDAIFKYMDAHAAQDEGGIDEGRLASAIVSACKSAGIGAVYLDGRQLAASINRETKRSGKPAINW